MILTPNAHVYWKIKGQKATKPILLLSPYLTGTVAQQLLSMSGNGRIYTQFDIELFASRASDLSVLKELMKAGHQLFHLDGLHAKVVLEQKVFATIGSQNVTSKGTRNLELNAVFSEESIVSQVYRKVEPWLKNGTPITPEMIADMEALLPPLVLAYEAFEANCKAAQAKIDKSAKQARLRKLKIKSEQARAKLRQEMKRVLEAVPISQNWDRGTVNYRQDSDHMTLFSSNQNLLHWQVNGVPARLRRLSRYLCVRETGEIGWARVASTRISMIGRGISFNTTVISEWPTWRIEVESRESFIDDLPQGANLVIKVKQDDRVLCVVPMRFALTSYRSYLPLSVQQTGDGEETLESKRARAWIRKNKDLFGKQVIHRITRPFKYGSNLFGEDASFFGALRSTHIIRVALIDENPVLVVKSGYYP